jgi:hypothetical protein
MNLSKPPATSAAETNWPALTATPLSVSEPVAGSVETFTASSTLAGVSFGSLKPKSAAAKVNAVSSRVVTVLSVPRGG